MIILLTWHMHRIKSEKIMLTIHVLEYMESALCDLTWQSITIAITINLTTFFPG